MRVVVDARIRSGETGGIESVVIGLASGIATLTDADDEYLFLTLLGEDAFLVPYLGSNSRTIHPGPPLPLEGPPDPNVPPRSEGTIEGLEADLIHFTSQAGFLTGVPSIYHPHDLQHLHLPQFFTAADIAWRDGWYPTLCEQASMVAVASSWTKRDVEQHYSLPADKVRVVPLAPPTSAYREMEVDEAITTRQRLDAPGDYVLYPAQTWEHKNHTGLLKALALLKERHGIVAPLVAPGRQNDFYTDIRHLQSSLGLDDQVVWPGFVSPDELQALYQGARVVAIPSRFEAGSFPMWEAFRAGVPVASSNVTSLPEQAGDAALIFDPDDVESMASAIHRLWTDETLRTDLVERGRRRVGQVSWETTARRFRAHYRRLAGSDVTADDTALLTGDS